MEKKEKNNKGLIVIIIFLVIALVGTSGYIVYDKVIKKEEPIKEKKDKPEEKEPVVREITEAEKTTLLNQINDYTTYFADSYPLSEKSSFNNQDVLYFASMQLENRFSDFMESDLEKVLEKYFGDNHSYVHEDIQCFLGDGVLYQYDSAKREYFFQDIHGHGGAGIYPAEIYYLDGQKKDEVYTVRVNILYGDYCYGTCGPVTGYYKSAIDSRNGENPVLGGFGDYYEITEEEYQSVKDNLPITTFTFIRDKDGNYGLVSVAIK